MPNDETPLARFLRQVISAGSSEMSRQIFLHRQPSELATALFEVPDALMKCLDAAAKTNDPRLYDDVYELLIKTAALIDKSRT
jgi:hypothetical protein